MTAFGLQKMLCRCVVANRYLVLCVIAVLAFVQPVRAQGKNDWIFVPRDAKTIAAALAALPGKGTIIVTAEAKSDPGFVAADFRDLSIVVTPSVPITGSAVFMKCTNVAFFAGSIENNLHIDTCTNVRTGPSGFVPTPPSMLSIRQAAYVKNSTDVNLVGLSFTKGAFGIRITTCMDKPAELLDNWRRSKDPRTFAPQKGPGVWIHGCEFSELAPLPGTTFPIGIAGSASYVAVWNSKFGPIKGYGIELQMGSLGGISQCTFEGLSGDAIYLTDAEGFVQNSTISGVVASGLGMGNGIHATLLPPAKNGSPRFLYVGPDRVANGVKISKCEGIGVWVEGGAGLIEPQIRECYAGIAVTSGFTGRLFSAIDNCDYGIWALQNFVGSIDGVVRDAKKVGVTVSGTKGPVTIGSPVTNSGETALFITDSQNVNASVQIINKFEGPPGGGIVVARSDVKFPRALVLHAARPAGFFANNSTITGTVTVSEGQGAGFFLTGSTFKGDYNTSKNLGPGFEITNKSEVTLIGQDILQDAGGAFVVSGGSKLQLTRCNVHGSTVPLKWRGPIDGAAPPDKFQYGIRASNDATVTARDCRIGSWARAGIFVSDAKADVNGCYISLHRGRDKNDYDGDLDAVYVRGKSKLVFVKGGFQVVGGNGFRVGQGGTLEVRDLKATEAPPMSGTAHRGHWLLVEADGDALVQNSDVSAWHADGIRVAKSGKARIIGNRIENGTFGHGIRVDAGSDTKVQNNRFAWFERKDPIRGTHFPIYAEIGAKIEESNNRAGAKDELVGPRR